MYGGIEAGGTKFICAVGSNPDDCSEPLRIPTTAPQETMEQVINYFKPYANELQAIGVSSFGPVDIDKASPHYGYITTTPKKGWQYFDFVGMLKKEFGLPVAFDVDVNGAAYGEYRWGSAQGLRTFIYLTVGTGIGGGGMYNGKLLHGNHLPEMGHIALPHDWERDPFAGLCPFHGDCLEGMASGVAMQKRWNISAEELPPDHPAWDLEAEYLARGLTNYILTLTPQRIILGGGVMKQSALFPKIRQNVQKFLNGYIKHPDLEENIDQFIVPPQLGDRVGVLGCLGLAQQLLDES